MRDLIFLIDNLLTDFDMETHYQVVETLQERDLYNKQNPYFHMYRWASCYASIGNKEFLRLYEREKISAMTDMYCNELMEKRQVMKELF